MGFKKCHISIATDGIDEDMLWNDSEEDGNVRSGCEEDEGTDCDTERATLGDKHNLTCFLYMKCIKLIVKYFFLSRFFL